MCIYRDGEVGYYGDRCRGICPGIFSDASKRIINNEKETALKCKGRGVDMWLVSTFVNSEIHGLCGVSILNNIFTVISVSSDNIYVIAV